MKEEDKILIATFCGMSPYSWLPNYDTDWNGLMKAIEIIEKHEQIKFEIPRLNDIYSIEKTSIKVLDYVKLLTKNKKKWK